MIFFKEENVAINPRYNGKKGQKKMKITGQIATVSYSAPPNFAFFCAVERDLGSTLPTTSASLPFVK